MRYARESLNKQNGVMLMELLIVILIIGLLLAGAVKTWDVTIQQTKFSQTVKEMDQLVYAIAGDPELYSEGRRTDFGYVGDMGKLPDTLLDLVRVPGNNSNWHGPYIKSNFAENVDNYIKDAWGNSYVYNKDSMIITSYTSGSYQTPQTWIHRRIAKSTNSLLYDTVSGRVFDIIGNPPGTNYIYLHVFITYPNGDSLWDSPSDTGPTENGYYECRKVPIGNHKIVVIYEPPASSVDTIEKFVCVYPGIVNSIDFRLTREF